MAGTNYSADKVAYNAAINTDITTQTAPNSIPPEVVGSGYTDLADLLEPYILRINNEALLQGSGVPSSGLGQDLDLYYQQTNPVIIWRKISGTWQQQVELPFGVILPEGNMTVRTFIDDFLVNATKGGWSINNVIYQKATQTLITVTPADANYTRIDNIYGNTINQVIYQEGIPSTSPIAPTLPAGTVLIDNVIVPSVASGNEPYLLYGGSIDVLDSGVEGPSTSTDNAIVRFNGTTGDTIKDSNVLLNDAGDIIMQGTGALKLPVGTTAERPSSPLDGHLRRNITLGELEYYDSDSGLWKQLGTATPGAYIENQNLLAQTANMWINGSIKAASYVITTTPSTSTGLYNLLTRDITTGAVEKITPSDLTGSFILNQSASAQTGAMWINGTIKTSSSGSVYSTITPNQITVLSANSNITIGPTAVTASNLSGNTKAFVANGSFGFIHGVNQTTISSNLITTSRNIVFPDASGTIALTTDIPTGATFIQNQNTSAQTANFWISGTGRFQGGAEVLKIGTNTGNADHAYLGFYRDQANPNTKSGQIGYTIAGNNTLIVENIITGANINVKTTSTGTIFLTNGANAISVTPVDLNLLSNTVTINLPSTSAGSYDILTRNTTNGRIEKIPSSSLGGGSATKTGTSVQNGSASLTYTITHGAGFTPTGVLLTVNSNDASGYAFVTVNATTITITYPTGRTVGTNNLSWSYLVF